LYDKNKSSDSNKEWVAVVVAHELAHQVCFLPPHVEFTVLLGCLPRKIHLSEIQHYKRFSCITQERSFVFQTDNLNEYDEINKR